MPSTVQLVAVTSTPIAVVRRIVPQSELSRAVPDGCGRAWNFVRSHRLTAGRNIAVYWDGAIRLEAGVEVAASFEPDGDIVLSATPAGTAATATHFGPYARLGAVHSAIREWCRTQGRQLAGPSWELYGHWKAEWNADPSQIRTDVFYQISEP